MLASVSGDGLGNATTCPDKLTWQVLDGWCESAGLNTMVCRQGRNNASNVSSIKVGWSSCSSGLSAIGMQPGFTCTKDPCGTTFRFRELWHSLHKFTVVMGFSFAASYLLARSWSKLRTDVLVMLECDATTQDKTSAAVAPLHKFEIASFATFWSETACRSRSQNLTCKHHIYIPMCRSWYTCAELLSVGMYDAGKHWSAVVFVCASIISCWITQTTYHYVNQMQNRKPLS